MIVPLQLSVKEKSDYICPPMFSAWFHVEIQFLYLKNGNKKALDDAPPTNLLLCLKSRFFFKDMLVFEDSG
jgi:hypothetical protein